MLNQALEMLGRFGRSSDASRLAANETQEKLQHLREHGYVIFDHLVGSARLDLLQADYLDRLENKLEFKTPTLAQSKIDPQRDADLIASNFFGTPQQLADRGLTFDRGDIVSYDQAVRDFRPSTLTTAMPDSVDWFDVWLDPKMLPVIEGYFGFVPHLEEAYIRRNYPSDFVVMNHAWHRDTNHSRHLLKAFVFLNDCTLRNGPHHYIAGTVLDRKLDGGGYFTEEEVRAHYPAGSERDIVSVVPAGTIILEDTRGLHKAGIPEEGYRDLGFATFLPPIALRRRPALYSLSRKTYMELSEDQRRYVPPQVVPAS